MARLRDFYRGGLRVAGFFSLFALGYFATGDAAYLGFLGFIAFPFMGGHSATTAAR